MGAPRKYAYDDARLIADAHEHPSVNQLAVAHGISGNALVKYLEARPDLQAKVRAALNGGAGTGAEPMPTVTRVEFENVDLGDARKLVQSRGMNVDDWLISGARVNEWGKATCPSCETEVGPLTQLRLDLKPRVDMLAPARPDGPRFKAAKPRTHKPGDRVLFLADPHAPYHAQGALDALAAWIERTGPIDRVVILGDVLDLPGTGRHRSMPGEPTDQECIESGYDWLRTVREIVGAAPIDWVPGNHDARIGLFALDNARALHGIRQANGGPQALGLTWLLRLDELAIRLHEHQHGWESGELEITPSLAAWHAPPSKRQADIIRYSVIHGHHHAQTWQTIPVMDQRNTVVGRRMVVGAGTMSNFSTGLGYAKAPGWTQGWCWADLWDDGEHEIAHVRYRDKQAWWPGGRLTIR